MRSIIKITGACAVLAAGDHLLRVAHPAAHDRAALQRGIDVAADAVPRLHARERRVEVGLEAPEVVRARPGRRVRAVFIAASAPGRASCPRR